MTLGRKRADGRIGLALLGCGMAALLPLAGCGSGSSSTASTVGTSVASGSPSAAQGTSESTPGAQAPWASALGTGVTVVVPQSVPAGHGSPGAVVTGATAAIGAKQAAAFCDYAMPSVKAQCESQLNQVPSKDWPYATNTALGYVAIDGKKAVVGTTGKFCTPGQSPECFTNNDPAAVFSAEHSFSALWSNAIKSSKGYSLTPCIEIDGKWYIYSSSS